MGSSAETTATDESTTMTNMTNETEGKEVLTTSPTAGVTDEFEFTVDEDEEIDDEIMMVSSPDKQQADPVPLTVAKPVTVKEKICFLVDSDDDEEEENTEIAVPEQP